MLERTPPSLRPEAAFTWPTHVAILLYGTTTLPSHLDALPVTHKTFDFSRNTAKQIKRLQDWLPTHSALCIDLLALSLGWRKSNHTDAAIELSALRLQIIQALQQHTSDLRWLACTQMGLAAFSAQSPAEETTTDNPPPGDPLALLLGGATTGFLKSATREWEIWCRCVDISDDLPTTWLHDELLDSTTHTEVLYHGKDRYTPTLAGCRENPPAENTAAARGMASRSPYRDGMGSGPVIVISGGGSGITARIVESLAGLMSFRAVILGRTSLPAPEEVLPLENKAEARKILRARLGQDASPRHVQEAMQHAEKQARLAQQIQRYRQRGIETMYIPTNMNDEAAVQDAMQQVVAQWDRVDAVIHGAGVDQSRELASKTPEELRFVMSVKLKGLAHLQTALREQPVRAWLAFGSVSSRFGNVGQVDYAAANEAMARWMVGDPAFQQPLVIDYTAWDEIGMAASLATFMKERGVDILPPGPTADNTAILWYQGKQGEWVYSGRLPAPPSPLGQASLRIPGTEVRYERPLQTGQFPFLQDHKMGDTEIQPGVVSLAWMQLAATEVGNGTLFRELQEIQFAKALKLFPGKTTTMQVQAQRASHTQQAETPATWYVQASISSRRERRGQTEQLHHAEARFQFSVLGSQFSVEDVRDMGASLQVCLDKAELAEDTGLPSIYETFFHGPTWQVLGQAWCGDMGAISALPDNVELLGQGLPEELRHNAVGQELVLQTAGLWALRKQQRFVLPFAIERLLLHADTEPHEPREAHVRFVGQKDDQLIFHAQLYGREQRLLQTFQGLRMRIFPMPA